MSPKSAGLSGLSVADLLKLQKETSAERGTSDAAFRETLLEIQAEIDKRAAAGEAIVEVAPETEE